VNELDLIQLWNRLRNQIIFSQLAPTFLLIVTIGLLNDGLAENEDSVKLATLGILLASGIFGFLAQYSAASEARAVLSELKTLNTKSKVSTQVIRFTSWINVIRFITPSIFVVIYVLLCIALLF
jgi:hypothetical protein